MTAISPELDTSNSRPSNQFDLVIELLLYPLLLFMPLAFGAVEAWSELVVVSVVTAASICLLLKFLFNPELRFRRSIALIPIVVFLFLSAIQLIPLPAGLVGAISPNSLGLRKQLLGEFISSSHNLDWITLSFYPLATRHDLRMVLVASAIFIIVLNVFRTPSRIIRLLTVIALIGGAIALLALAQDFTHATRIYWLIPADPKANSGPFVSHTHFGQFMNLSMGATLALLLIYLHQRPIRLSVIVALVVIVTLSALAITLSLTRGGIVSMFIAAVAVGILLAWRRGIGKSALIVVLVGAVLAISLYPWLNVLVQRLSSTNAVAENRLQTIRDCGAACAQFPFFGAGLGTHEFIFPMFDRSCSGGLSTYAENEYAQVAEELGIPGLLLVLAFVAFIATAFIRVIRRLDHPIQYAAFGLAVGLLAVMIHSFSDFGQHLPAIFCLSAAFCALILNVESAFADRPIAVATRITSPLKRSRRGSALVVALAIGLWSISETNSARRAESLWTTLLQKESSFRRRDWQGSDQAYSRLITAAEDVARIQPQNVTYRHWLNVYRWHSISRRRDTSAHKVTVTDQSLADTRKIIDDFQETVWLCPTFGPSWTFMGQLEFNILRIPQGANHIRTGYLLNQSDINACEVAGAMAVKQQDWKLATEAFSHAAAVWPYEISEAVQHLLDRAHRPDLLIQAASGNMESMRIIIAPLSASPAYLPYAREAHKQAIRLLEAEAASDRGLVDVHWHAIHLAELAELYVQDSRYAESVELYRRAFDLYGPADPWLTNAWRFSYAQALIHLGRPTEARTQLNVALQSQPDWKEAKSLLDSISPKTN